MGSIFQNYGSAVLFIYLFFQDFKISRKYLTFLGQFGLQQVLDMWYTDCTMGKGTDLGKY